MKLEQYLAIGVTTGLKCVVSGYYTEDSEYLDNKIPIVFDVTGLNEKYVECSGRLKTVSDSNLIEDCFPICRPLSDLTEPIEHNGEVFVPIDYLWFNVIGTDNDCFSKDVFYELIESGYFKLYPFEVVLKLIEWHFAIGDFEFIPVTKEFNPYK